MTAIALGDRLLSRYCSDPVHATEASRAGARSLWFARSLRQVPKKGTDDDPCFAPSQQGYRDFGRARNRFTNLKKMYLGCFQLLKIFVGLQVRMHLITSN